MKRRGFLLRGLTLAGGATAWRLGQRRAEAAATTGAAAARPAGGGGRPKPRTLAAGLAAMDAALGLRLTRFERSHPVAEATAALGAGGGSRTLALDGATVTCRVRATPARDRADATDLEVSCRTTRGRLPDATLALTLTLGAWSRDAYLFVPGAVYAGNRFESRHVPYPPLLAEPADIGPHVPPIVSDIPRLSVHPAGPSRIALVARDTAAPAIGVHLPGASAGAVLLAGPHTAAGEVGILIEESDDRRRATIAVTIPAVRPDVRYTVCDNRTPSTDRGAHLFRGVELTLKLRLLAFPCADVPALYDRWFEARRDLLGAVRWEHVLPLGTGRRLIEERLLADRRLAEPGLFPTAPPTAAGAPTPAPGVRAATAKPAFQTGGDGALALVVPLLAAAPAAGADAPRGRAEAVMNLLLRGQAASGLFHAAGDGTRWWDEGEESVRAGGRGHTRGGGTGGGTPTAGAVTARRSAWTHVGRNAEALHLGLKLILLLERPGENGAARAPERWRAGLGRCADALVRLWGRYRQLGQYVVTESGEIAVGGSAAGALAPAALALAARVLDNERYLQAATAVAEALHARFVRAGITAGGAPAALQCPDSRSAAGLLESFVTLGEITGNAAWFGRAADAAQQLASWVVAWDAPLPADSPLGRMDARTTGAVLVSAQDRWALPGFPGGLSGGALFRLFRATGRVAFLDLLRETVHNATRYISSPGADPAAESGAPPAGWVAPRIAFGDAVGPPGGVPAAGPGAAEAACLSSAAEIPSLYVQPDTGFVFCFDHVEARARPRDRRGDGRLVVSLRNPTRFPAELRIFSEADRDRDRPLDPWPLLDARTLTLTLAAGATEDLEIREGEWPGSAVERRPEQEGPKG